MSMVHPYTCTGVWEEVGPAGKNLSSTNCTFMAPEAPEAQVHANETGHTLRNGEGREVAPEEKGEDDTQ